MFIFKSLLIPTLCSLSLSLYAQDPLSFKDKSSSLTYLLWDNQTPATIEDLLADPLLIIRTSERYSDHEDGFKNAYQRVANLDFISAEKAYFPHLSNSSQESSQQNEQSHKALYQSFLKITNKTNDFVFSKPFFSIKASLPCEKICWQISLSEDFSIVMSTLERVSHFTGTIFLSDLEETFLDNETTYYFRVKAGKDQVWGAWSSPFEFTVVKPVPVENLRMESTNGKLQLVWKANDHKDASYLIFGSNSLDFIPDIYSEVQINTVLSTHTVTSSNHNFLGKTYEASFPIQKRYAYYRVITKVGDSLSKPSSLLPIDDGMPAPDRDVLQQEFDHASRQKLPQGYPWMQKKVSNETTISTQYVQNPYVSEVLWNTLSPYFLPEHFPEKAALDRIFSQRRVLSSIKSMYKSGFNLLTKPDDKIVVARHPHLKGYLIKAYTDEMNFPDWYWWKKRIDGMRAIQNAIIENGFQGIMKAPKKWIYPLPPEPQANEKAPYPKYFILVVEEMDILNFKKNRKAYKKQMTPEILDAYYTMLTSLLLIDSVYADNTIFCRDGRLAFVDSEHSLDTTMPVPITLVAQYLSPEMHAYWEQLIVNGGPRH